MKLAHLLAAVIVLVVAGALVIARPRPQTAPTGVSASRVRPPSEARQDEPSGAPTEPSDARDTPAEGHEDPGPGANAPQDAAPGTGAVENDTEDEGDPLDDDYVEMAAYIMLMARGLPETPQAKRYLDERVELYLETKGVTRQELDDYTAGLSPEQRKRFKAEVRHRLFEMEKIEVEPTGLGRPVAPDEDPLEGAGQ